MVSESDIEHKLKFRFNQKVTIKSGFYKGFSGVVTGWFLKGEKVIYKVEMNVDGQTREIEERSLRIAWRFPPF